MRILHLTDLYRPFIGGLERHIENLAREQARRGHHVAVATLRGAGLPEFEVDDVGVRVHRMPASLDVFPGVFATDSIRFHPTTPDPRVMWALRRILSEEQPDIVHAAGWIVHSMLPLKRASGPKLIFTQLDYGLACPKKTFAYRDGTFCTGPSLSKCIPCASGQYGPAKGSVLSVGLRASRPLYRRLDLVISVSGFVSNAIRLPGVPTIQIPTFIDEPPDDPRSLPRPDFLPEQDGYVMFVGAMGPHKGVDVLIEAFRQGYMNGEQLLLIGTRRPDSPTDFPPGVHALFDRPNTEVLAAWARCSVAVVPSVWAEPFGQVAIEAMACSRPVVASRTGGLQEIVVDGDTGVLVPPGDVAALGGAIRRLLADQALRAQYGEAGRRRARAFTVGPVTDAFDLACARVLAG